MGGDVWVIESEGWRWKAGEVRGKRGQRLVTWGGDAREEVKEGILKTF